MSRALLIYGDRHAPMRTFDGFDPDGPVPGFYRMKLVSGGIAAGIRIWNGPPHDPIDGTELDRSWRIQATANGEPIPIARVWPKCADEPIAEAEHDYLVALQRWGQVNAPGTAIADPRKRMDLLNLPIPI